MKCPDCGREMERRPLLSDESKTADHCNYCDSFWIPSIVDANGTLRDAFEEMEAKMGVVK